MTNQPETTIAVTDNVVTLSGTGGPKSFELNMSFRAAWDIATYIVQALSERDWAPAECKGVGGAVPSLSVATLLSMARQHLEAQEKQTVILERLRAAAGRIPDFKDLTVDAVVDDLERAIESFHDSYRAAMRTRDDAQSERDSARAVIRDLQAEVRALERAHEQVMCERDLAAADRDALTAELEKPVARAWVQRGPIWERDCGSTLGTSVSQYGWRVWTIMGSELAHGPETGSAGKHALDVYLGGTHHLVGGAYPAPAVGESSHD